MNILYINENDLGGRRFNGHDLQIMLNKKGYKAKQFVAYQEGEDENTMKMIKTDGEIFIRSKCKEFEERISMQSVIYPFGDIISESDEFKEANIVHYHLIFNHFMSLFSFKKMVNMKPSVWTLHDPWALTGHCVHPIDCEGWLTGCKNCPHLDRYSPLKEDNSSSIWNLKKEIYKDLDLDIVVSSQWMYDLVKRSPLTKHFERVHVIPFGIDLDLFKRRENRDEIRKSLNIDKDSFVIMFRQDDQEWKGSKYIKGMLDKLKVDRNVTILTVGRVGLLDEYKEKYQLIEYEWVNDDNCLVDLYSVADVFLMPSVAESFGMMAIEAMACSLPVVVMEGSALPSVTHSPSVGIPFKRGRTDKFVSIVESLIRNPGECIVRAKSGRKLVEKNYSLEKHFASILDLYKDIYTRGNK